MLSAVYRRAAPDGDAWNVEVIANYQSGTGASGVCSMIHVTPNASGRLAGRPGGRASSTAASRSRATWTPIPIRPIARHEIKLF